MQPQPLLVVLQSEQVQIIIANSCYNSYAWSTDTGSNNNRDKTKSRKDQSHEGV